MSHSVSKNQIRSFHLTAKGLDHYTPEGPLRLAGGWVSAASSHTEPAPLIESYAKALAAQRGLARARFLDNLRYCHDRMRELLAVDDSRDETVSRSPAALSASLGPGVSFFDSGALAVALQTSASHPVERMDRLRRKRCERTLKSLHEAMCDAAIQPPYWEFPSADIGAIAFCERQLDAHAAALRAMRVARLEFESAYEPAIHDEALERFSWESADPEELAAMPAVLVVDSADRVAENSLTVFGRLLRSGLPMQILITCPPFYLGDLAFMAVAHREAFVLQSSTACPAHLTEGLTDMTRTLRPAVAVVSSEDPPFFFESRTFPMYVYDPEAGEDWIERFRLRATPLPAPEVNAAHAAALSPDMIRHFRVIPKDSWDDEQVEWAAYLNQYGKQPPLSVPFLSILDEDGAPQRAVLTRELVEIARDRRRAWKLLDELAGAGRPAAPPVDVDAVRKDAVKDTIYRAIALLHGGPAPEAKPVVEPASKIAFAPVVAKPPVEPPPKQAEEAPPAVSTEPYIDSSMCTSCNDCMKINSRMFLYNADKQAYVGDPNAGTFSELVKAAEGCPARCIHPGSPRAGDKTATPQLIARAAKFN